MTRQVTVATWSPCCRSVRTGEHSAGVMHSGLCRDAHHGEPRMGELGPTVRLVVHPDDRALLEGYTVPIGLSNLFSCEPRPTHVLVPGCACYRCKKAANA